MRHLGALRRQGFIVELTCSLGIETEIELIFPAELEARLAEGVVAILGARMALGQVGGVGGDLVGDDAVLDVFLIRQSEMLFRRHVTEHRRAVPADHRRADGTGNMIVARRDIGGQRPESVERRFVASFQLLGHVFMNHVHRHMAGPFDHHLDIMLPGDLGQLAKGFQLAELRFVVGIGDAAGAQTVAQ